MALQPVHIVVVGIVGNAAHSLNKFQMAPEPDAPPLTDLWIGLKVNKADNTFTIIDSGIGMTNQDLADFVMNGKQNKCGSIRYPIDPKVEKELELNKGKIPEVAEDGQVIHEPKALGPSSNPLVANMVDEARAKDPNVLLCAATKAYLRGKVDDVIMAEPGSFVADIPCQIKVGILELNPNNEKVKKLTEMVERGETVELAVELLYDYAIILNKPKKSVWNRIWKRMIGSLCTCVITHGAVAAVELALNGDVNA